MKLGDYIEMHEADAPNYKLFYGHIPDDEIIGSVINVIGIGQIKCIERTYARITKFTVKFNDQKKIGYSKVTMVFTKSND